HIGDTNGECRTECKTSACPATKESPFIPKNCSRLPAVASDRSMGAYRGKSCRHKLLSAVLPAATAGCLLWAPNIDIRAQDSQVSIEQRVSAVGGADRVSPNIHVNSDLVLIPVTVTDYENRMITGLAREHFRLWDEKTEQPITHFATEDVPVSIGLVFDASGSMATKLAQSRAAVMEFIKTANPDDEFSFIAFNDRPRLLQGFTSRAEEIQERMMFVEPRGRTALLDAIFLSLNEMRNAKHSRKAILIISDGGDNESRYTWRELKGRLREA